MLYGLLSSYYCALSYAKVYAWPESLNSSDQQVIQYQLTTNNYLKAQIVEYRNDNVICRLEYRFLIGIDTHTRGGVKLEYIIYTIQLIKHKPLHLTSNNWTQNTTEQSCKTCQLNILSQSNLIQWKVTFSILSTRTGNWKQRAGVDIDICSVMTKNTKENIVIFIKFNI